MYKYLIAILLITSTIQHDTLFLTPTYPPTAFFEQFYEVRFRAIGLSNPTFTFTNLPSFLKGSESGIVSGVPTSTGTFKVTVTYTDGTSSGSSTVSISVTSSPNTEASAKQSAEVVYLIIENAVNSWIYRTDQIISIKLVAKHGHGPITWNFNNLPKGLSGDNNGGISGSISQIGVYSFSAQAGDSRGLKAEAYYTLNIQPGTLIKTNNVLDVPDRSVPVVYDLGQVQAQQIAADTAVVSALKQVNAARAEVAKRQSDQGRTQAAVNIASTQQKSAEVTLLQAQSQQVSAENQVHRTESNLKTAQNIVEVATTALKNADAVLADAKINLANAQSKFNAAKASFDVASAAYTKAAVELSQAQTDYNKARDERIDAQNSYNLAWNNLQTAKANLDQANNRLIQAKQTTKNARNAVNLATQANDDAQANLNIADAALNAAQKALEDANKQVANQRGGNAAAKTALGVANFQLNQALANLFVAQAAKEAADKALAIAFAQGVDSIKMLDGESTYIFNGCLAQAYPTISGTVTVEKLIPNGAQLSSGQVLTWGECTTKDVINVGDLIEYHGAVTGSSISASKITIVHH